MFSRLTQRLLLPSIFDRLIDYIFLSYTPPSPFMSSEDPEDILSSSLETFYDHRQVTLSTSPGSLFTYTYPGPSTNPVTVELATPDTHASNWSLHASSIWASSKFMADIILPRLDLSICPQPTRVLEVGAGAGLPAIVLSLLHPPEQLQVTVSDYPDELLISDLSKNVSKNIGTRGNCRAVGYGWGEDPTPTLFSNDPSHPGFDIIIGSDTLWNPEFHKILVSTLHLCLRKSSSSRVHLVAGLHTGRYTLASFLRLAETSKMLEIEKIVEMESSGSGEERPWSVDRADEGEEEKDRRRWVVWIVLRWTEAALTEAA